MPTMMSARPSRSISWRMAGVRAVCGTTQTVPPSAAWHPADDPFGVRAAGQVATVSRLERQALEALGAPRVDPVLDRRPDERTDPDRVGLDEHAFQEPAPLHQRHVEQRR